ncbi:MAG: SAM hydrolase/SAM-dependent halogenase family protein [Sciscionella sp.]
MRFDWISFTSDFGLSDGYVAACHGVLARLAPAARVLDVTHQVPAQNLRHGAAVLAQTLPYLPEAVHLAVVDPGVGTARRGVVLRAGASLLVGPDNGLLIDAAAALGGIDSVHELRAPAYRAAAVSATFHGRDVFSPAAAHLALGVAVEEFGPALPGGELVRLAPPELHVTPGEIGTEVLTVDSFGNLQLAAGPDALRSAGITGPAVSVTASGQQRAAILGETFGSAPVGEAVLHVDSAGLLSVAVNGGSAAQVLRYTGGPIVLRGEGGR